MRKIVSLLSLFAIASLMCQCSDLTEPNLNKSKYSIKLVSPADSVSTEIQSQVFIWEPIKGANEYQFQLAYPSFEKAQIMLVDSTISGTSFAYNFNFTGDYEWRVKAKNTSSETKYTINRLHVTKVLSLSKQTPFIYGPADSLFTNETNLTISWKKIKVATNYVFTLQQNNSNGKYIIENDSTSGLSFTLPLQGKTLSEGIYYWTLTATNDTAESATIGRTFIIDRTIPSAPTLLFPKADTLIQDTTSVQLKFTWKRLNSDVLYDSIYFLDSDQKTVLFRERTSYEYFNYTSPWSLTDRYWKIKSFDKAGNASGDSNIRKYSFKKK